MTGEPYKVNVSPDDPYALAAALSAAKAALREALEALRDLHAEVEMAESIGICLPDRVPSLRARDLLARWVQ